MGLLAYDPVRVARLQRALDELLAALRATRCADPSATAAMQAVRVLAAHIEEQWLPLTSRVLSADPLTSRQRRDAQVDRLDRSLVKVMADGYGWSVLHDPLSAASTVTPADARALGARLNDDSTVFVDDPEQMRWLARQLAIIGNDSALSREFLANFHDWAELCDRLAGHRALLLSGEPFATSTTVAALDDVFAGLGLVAGHDLPSGACPMPDAVLPEMDLMHPYSAALVVRHLGLSGDLLGQLSEHLLSRWLDVPRQHHLDRPPTDVHLDGPNTADLLLPLVSTDPVAARWLVTAAVQQPDLLFATADDPELAHRLVLSATDPAHMSAADAAAVIVPIIEHFADGAYPLGAAADGYDGSWELFLVDLVAPWTLQFAPLNREFGLDPERQARLLGFVIDDADALDRLVADAAIVEAGVLRSLGNGSARALDEFASYIGLLGGLVVRERVDDEERAAAAFEMVIRVAGLATALVPGVPIVAGVAMGAGLEATSAFAPFDPVRVARDAQYAHEYSLTVTAAAVATTVSGMLSNAGALPRGLPDPPLPDPHTDHPAVDYLLSLDRWLETLPGGFDGTAAQEIRLHTSMVLNHERAAEFLAD